MRRVAKQWVRNPSDVLAVSQGCFFDAVAAKYPCDFIEKFCKQSKGRWKGQPLNLLHWQTDFLMRLFGWKLPSGLRRFRRAYLEVAKKNGKSTLISGVGLYLLLADGEGSPEIYLNACDKAQASIVFEEQRRMVESSSELKSRLEIQNSLNNKRIIDVAGNGAIIANSSIAGSKDGLNPSGVIFDELHRQPDRRLWDVFEYAGASRSQPIRLSITTAGEDEDGVWHEERDYAEKINAGVIPDISFLGVVYRALPDDDIDDPDTWLKANPSLGQTINIDDFSRELQEAKKVPAKLSNFKRLRLDIVAREATKFVAIEAWDRCSAKPVIRPNDPCWIGFDLASVNDLTALAVVAENEIDGFDVLIKFFLPEDNISELELEHDKPYRTWADMGLITLTPGASVDYGFVRKEILALAGQYDLRSIFADPHNAVQLIQDLTDEDGLTVKAIRQGGLSLNAPTKELLRLILDQSLRHGGHPILRWNCMNCVATTDENENIRLNKKKSKKKIDGMAALVNALAAATDPGDDTSPSEHRRIRFI